MFSIIYELEDREKSFFHTARLLYASLVKNKIVFEDINFYNSTIRLVHLPFCGADLNFLSSKHPFFFKRFLKNLKKITKSYPVYLAGPLQKSALSSYLDVILVDFPQIYRHFIKKCVKKACQMFYLESTNEEALILSGNAFYYIDELKDIIRHFTVLGSLPEEEIEHYYEEFGITVKCTKANTFNPKICIADGKIPNFYTYLVFDVQNKLPYLHNIIKTDHLHFNVPLPFKIVAKHLPSLPLGNVICLIYSGLYDTLSFGEFIDKFGIELTGVIRPKY